MKVRLIYIIISEFYHANRAKIAIQYIKSGRYFNGVYWVKRMG